MSEKIRPAELNKYLQEIADINGIPPSQVDIDELRLHYGFIQNGHFDPFVINKYIGPDLVFTDYRRYTERMNLLVQLSEAVLEEETKFPSYGLFLPDYLAALTGYKQTHRNREEHTGLLVGVQTTNSVDEFSFALKSTFSNAYLGIIDLEGKDTGEAAREHAFFAFANAVTLPFRLGTFDSIHTNLLLPYLGDERRKFFDQSRLALKPGGMLVMAETDHTDNTQEFSVTVKKELRAAGFSRVSANPAMKLNKRYNVDRMMNGENLAPTSIVPSDKVTFFVAHNTK